MEPQPKNVSEENVNTHQSRLLVTSSYLVVAIRDNGACSTLRSVAIIYFACPRFQRELIEFPRTLPQDVEVAVPVQGRCVSGSFLPRGVSLPLLTCMPDGRWCTTNQCARPQQLDARKSLDRLEEISGKCVCMPGHGLSLDQATKQTTCRLCAENEYKILPGSTPCRPCPKYSYRPQNNTKRASESVAYLALNATRSNFVETYTEHSVASSACLCLYGYYRHPKLDTEDSACSSGLFDIQQSECIQHVSVLHLKGDPRANLSFEVYFPTSRL
ncbi:unnamed protein product [Dicrocoelium dendriticum]|nr:unnamed protein product [Dicrocoelium dendriticum]